MKTSLRKWFVAVVTAPLFLSAQIAAADEIPPVEIKTIAEGGYYYGLPLVMAYTANYEFWLDKSSPQYKGPMNELVHSRRVFTCEDTAVIVPNSGKPYSFSCLDLRAGPWVVSVPEMDKERYFSVQLVDWNTFNCGYLINSPMLPGMKKNDDGSLTLHIRKDSPGADKASNWLPAPDGPVYLVMRLYWPQTESPPIQPPGEGDWAPPAIRKTN